MKSTSILHAAAVLLLWASNGFSQEETPLDSPSEIDTLYYFDLQNIVLNPIYTGDVDSAGIFFTPDSTWKRYELLELHFLFVAGLVDSAHPTFDGDIFIRTSAKPGQPGRLIVKAPFQVAGVHETYPDWKKISLQDMPEVKNLQGNFWLEGIALLGGIVSLSKSNHTYVHSANVAINWQTSLDIVARVIVKNRTSTEVAERKTRNGGSHEIIISNHPNPFNASTVLVVKNESMEKRASIKIYNMHGQIMASVFDGSLEAGIHRFIWRGIDLEGKDATSGLYFCYVVLGQQEFYRKLIVIR